MTTKRTSWNKGKRLTKAHRDALSEAHLGKPSQKKGKPGNPNKYKGKKMPWVGHSKPHTIETKNKISEILLASPNVKRGAQNHRWTGGLRKCVCGNEIKSRRKDTVKCGECAKKNPSRYWAGKKRPELTGANNQRWITDRSKLSKGDEQRNSPAHREWSRSVKNRDGWQCRIANGDCSGQVVAHHILGWKDHPELRYEPNNGITLCHFHHPRKRDDEAKLSPYFQSLVMSNSK